MKGDTQEERPVSYFAVGVAALVFVVTFVTAVVFSVYILNRIDSVEKEVSLIYM